MSETEVINPAGVWSADTGPEYFAVVDPLHPDEMTFWYRSRPRRGSATLQPWPPRTTYGRLSWKDVPFDRKTQRAECDAFLEAHWARVRAARAVIVETIEADVVTGGVRFAMFHARCCRCGRELTDPRSKAYGIGPECRHGAPREVLDLYVRHMGRALAAAETVNDEAEVS